MLGDTIHTWKREPPQPAPTHPNARQLWFVMDTHTALVLFGIGFDYSIAILVSVLIAFSLDICRSQLFVLRKQSETNSTCVQPEIVRGWVR
jgi:hypothetical protein